MNGRHDSMNSNGRRIRADTHVHFHACFDEGPFLDAAADNLNIEAAGSPDIHAVVCLTETADAQWYERLTRLDAGERFGDSEWRIQSTGEPNSLLAVDKSGRKLAIIAGRQIVCSERLEVLALGYAEAIADGQPIRSVLRTVASSGALPVVPWGFGKWSGARGTIVKELLYDAPCQFVLGDNGGRLGAVAEPALFAEARERGIAILPGTDPFPFQWDSRRVGSFGLEWAGGIDSATPFSAFRELVWNRYSAAKRYGRLESIPSFFRNQIAIQLKRLTAKSQQ